MTVLVSAPPSPVDTAASKKENYEDRVKVFPDRLAKALPDTLLDSLARN